MRNSLKAGILDGILFLLLFGVFYFYANYMYIGGFGIGYQYIGCGVIIVIVGLVFLTAPELTKFSECMKSIGVMTTPYLVCMLFSLGIWIFTFTGLRQMISGFFAPIYIIICTFCVGCLIYMLGEKAVTYTFWAMSAAFFVMIIQQILIAGVGEFFYELYMLVISASLETLPVMRSLEGPRFSYCYGLYFLYFIIRRKQTSRKVFVLRMLVCVFCFMVGFKRSCILAVACGAAIAFLYIKLRNTSRNRMVSILISAFLIFAVVYIPVVRYGLFERIVESLDIDTSHRDELYDIYAEYYQYNPSYMGRGLGWVQNHLKSQEGLAAYDVHNEFLRNYIELGFWGYLFWAFFAFPWIVKCSAKGKNPRQDGIVIGSMVYAAILYITENIFFFYTFSITLCAVIMECRQCDDEKMLEDGRKGLDRIV